MKKKKMKELTYEEGIENSTSLACLMPGVKQEINKYLKDANPKDKSLI